MNMARSLQTSTSSIEAVLVTHFRNVFAVPPPAAPLPHPPPSMLFDKSSIDERWRSVLLILFFFEYQQCIRLSNRSYQISLTTCNRSADQRRKE